MLDIWDIGIKGGDDLAEAFEAMAQQEALTGDEVERTFQVMASRWASSGSWEMIAGALRHLIAENHRLRLRCASNWLLGRM